MVRRKQLTPKACYPSQQCCRRRINNDTKEENNNIEEGEPDRLSDLPESLLSNILSRLPTKEAVQTSVLSRKWVYKWARIYNLDFSETTSNLCRKVRFSNFVQRVLINGGYSSIQNFHLHCFSDHEVTRVQDWIAIALRRNVEKLTIDVCNESLVLPCSIYESKILKELKLLSKVTLSLPNETIFFQLREITFNHVIIRNQDSRNGGLLLKFPFLESLSMYSCHWINVISVKLDAPLLTTFVTSDMTHHFHNRFDEFVFEIYGSKLVDFKLRGELIQNFVLSNPSPVQSATMELSFSTFWISKGNLVARILRQMNALTYLELSGDVLNALKLAAEINNLPLFRKLVHLKLYTTSNSFTDAAVVVGLLQKTPVLQILSMDMSTTMENEWMYNGVINEAVPPCFASHLKEVKFLCAYDDCLKRYENLELMLFILNNAKKLQLMEIIDQKNTSEIRCFPSFDIYKKMMRFSPRFASVVFR